MNPNPDDPCKLLQDFMTRSCLDAVNEFIRTDASYAAYVRQYRTLLDEIGARGGGLPALLGQMDAATSAILDMENECAYRRGMRDAVAMLRELGLLALQSPQQPNKDKEDTP